VSGNFFPTELDSQQRRTVDASPMPKRNFFASGNTSAYEATACEHRIEAPAEVNGTGLSPCSSIIAA
jgi:hypothetical protein